MEQTAKIYQALILDMDGTLLNSKKMVTESLTLLAKEYGISLTPAQYLRGFGCTAETLMEELGLPHPDRAADRWRAIMEDMLGDVPLFAGVDQVLAAPIRRGVVTSQTREELTRNLERLSLEGAFEYTVTVDDTPFHKPHPRPLLHCLERMEVGPEEALFVGDSSYDYGCAKAAGVDFGVATWGADKADHFPGATHRFQAPPDMVRYIASCAEK